MQKNNGKKECPYCSDPNISVVRALLASEFAPAVCKRCGGKSILENWLGGKYSTFFDVLFWVTFIWGLTTDQLAIFAIFPLVFIGYLVLRVKSEELHKVSDKEVLDARQWIFSNVLLVGLLIAVVAAIIKAF
ncbi:hypothetical protein [Marinobacter sp. HL-58]|uniref:hypothetical protein n=1 Tax=Marinobacter sp. HL-58 TaxID=1479237 RepID=UPI0012DC31EE|nr:hypothetical protein [Marinobacter sp. HL-58]